MKLINKRNEEIIANRVEIADSFWSKFKGLMLRRSFPKDKALVFILSEPKRYSIHTFFMFFPIDLIYLNEDFEVIEIKKGLSPWSTYKSSEKASFLIEFSSGRVNEVDVNMGDELKLGDKGQRG